MYDIPHHKEKDAAKVHQFIHDHPFALISGISEENKPVATQVPLLLVERDGKMFLQGHIMRKTDHHVAFLHNQSVMATFSGAHAYVSATWYSNPSMGSTWNFMTVHASGIMQFMEEHGLRKLMSKLTLHFENGNLDSPTIFDNLSDEYKDRMIKAIIGFEIEVEKLDHVFKLSQDRDLVSFERIIKELSKQGGNAKAIAKEMEDRKESLFSV